jgi:thiol-disulfide isomerase/thioredoxin
MTLAFYLSYAALWALVVFLTLVVLGLVRNGYRLQPDGAAADGNGSVRGGPLPEFSTVDLGGVPISSSTIRGRLTALLFVGSDCGSCALTLHDLEALHAKAESNVVVFCQGEPGDCANLAETFRIADPVVSDAGREISELFSITTLPTAVIVGEDGRIASVGNPLGGQELEEMIAKVPAPDDDEPDLVLHHGPAPEHQLEETR